MIPSQLKNNIIIPVLKYLQIEIPFSFEAVDLLMMTCAHESLMGKYIQQMDGGPAQGLYQMEPNTEKDIFKNFLEYRPELKKLMVSLKMDWESSPQLYSPFYATAMARVHYYRVPQPLPKKSHFRDKNLYYAALASYAKEHYNTNLGSATVNSYYRDYLELVVTVLGEE